MSARTQGRAVAAGVGRLRRRVTGELALQRELFRRPLGEALTADTAEMERDANPPRRVPLCGECLEPFRAVRGDEGAWSKLDLDGSLHDCAATRRQRGMA